MDYKKAWNELKSIINEKYENEFDDIPVWIYKTILNNINKIENKYKED